MARLHIYIYETETMYFISYGIVDAIWVWHFV